MATTPLDPNARTTTRNKLAVPYNQTAKPHTASDVASVNSDSSDFEPTPAKHGNRVQAKCKSGNVNNGNNARRLVVNVNDVLASNMNQEDLDHMVSAIEGTSTKPRAGADSTGYPYPKPCRSSRNGENRWKEVKHNVNEQELAAKTDELYGGKLGIGSPLAIRNCKLAYAGDFEIVPGGKWKQAVYKCSMCKGLSRRNKDSDELEHAPCNFRHRVYAKTDISGELLYDVWTLGKHEHSFDGMCQVRERGVHPAVEHVINHYCQAHDSKPNKVDTLTYFKDFVKENKHQLPGGYYRELLQYVNADSEIKGESYMADHKTIESIMKRRLNTKQGIPIDNTLGKLRQWCDERLTSLAELQQLVKGSKIADGTTWNRWGRTARAIWNSGTSKNCTRFEYCIIKSAIARTRMKNRYSSSS